MLTDTELKKGSVQTLILAVLSDGPRHGYAIARQIERRSAEALSFGEGALYPALRALEREELVVSEWQAQPSGPARRVYTLTDAGQARLAAQVRAWRRFSGAVDLILKGHGGTPMFSRFSGDEVDTFLRRLNAQLTRLPHEDRVELHLELRQHLEELAAAHEELGATRDEAVRAALSQFGDPRRFGRRMFREWRLSQPLRFGPAALPLLGVFNLLAVSLVCFCWHGQDGVLVKLFEYGLPLVSGASAGLLLPGRAPHTTALVVTFAVPAIGLGVGLCDHSTYLSALAGDNGWLATLALDWLTLGAASAWVVGRLRRGRVPSPHRS